MPQSPRNLDFNAFPFVPRIKAREMAVLCERWGNTGLFSRSGKRGARGSRRTTLREAVLLTPGGIAAVLICRAAMI
jgi:hypothetical protein